MQFLIDGYNLLYAMNLMRPRLGPHGLEKARNALVGRLAGALGPQAAQATVVFDAAAAPPDVPRAEPHQGVRVLFTSKGEEADDRIERLLPGYAPKQLTVVSDDNRLIQAAQHRGCHVMKCDAFLAWLDRRHATRRPSSSEPREKTQGTSETEQWLQEFADLDDDPTLGRRDEFAG
jgi:predicted RNA-binding protein with PIN domain